MKKVLAALIALSVTMSVAGNISAEKASKQESNKQVYYMADPGGSVG
ncbi:hypothetical protein PDN20_28360 [Bacillus cereus]|nr:hypothetical protein [Bacillus cereus]MDA2130011.1 hypothetical protein [Bacillus cereus]MDA2152512.1 hypothetical protein [Bacillus cereus]